MKDIKVFQLVYILILGVGGFSLGLSQHVRAWEGFTIQDIQIQGLHHISLGTVLNYLPLQKGHYLDASRSNTAISSLFKTGFFKDVRLEREGNVLIVSVEERPAISKITFAGNKDIETEELSKALKNIGFAEGRIFNRSLLEKVELELQRQYFSLGKYAVRIKSAVTPLDGNRVAIQIDISEGIVAVIRQIHIIGNHALSEKELLGEMELDTTGWFSFFTKDDQYSKQKLSADLEALRSYYLDRGYINFSLDSTQVSITPDKKDIYVTINLTEGNQYTLSKVKLEGNLIVKESELLEQIKMKPGEIFSRKALTQSTEAILEKVGEQGYAFANVNAVPEVNEQDKTVTLSFFIDPGKRIYVRRINFKGNMRTRDEVLRREMRQMEGAWFSTRHVKRSLTRLERLGYFDEVKVETPSVPHTPDQVDIQYTVVEKPLGNLMAGIGYSQTQGFLVNASIMQDNFLGSGKRLGLNFNNSQVNTVYSLSYLNPYVTIDGISRGFNLFYRKTDAEEANLSRYTTDAYGGSVDYGIPVTEFNQIGIGGTFDHTKLKSTFYSAQEVYNFIRDHGDTYDSYRLNAHWEYDSRNRVFLPDEGTLQTIGAEVALPFSDLQYYKLHYHHQWFYPLLQDYTLLLEGEMGYGKGYQDTQDLPFFENYTAGGPRSVRGFRENTLGPLDSNGRPLGGNLKVVGNMELILPLPWTKKVRSFRVSSFLDIGNVYGADEQFKSSELRYSAGVSAIWMSPIGILSFSWANPLNKKEGDQIQRFQFSIGTSF